MNTLDQLSLQLCFSQVKLLSILCSKLTLGHVCKAEVFLKRLQYFNVIMELI